MSECLPALKIHCHTYTPLPLESVYFNTAAVSFSPFQLLFSFSFLPPEQVHAPAQRKERKHNRQRPTWASNGAHAALYDRRLSLAGACYTESGDGSMMAFIVAVRPLLPCTTTLTHSPPPSPTVTQSFIISYFCLFVLIFSCFLTALGHLM